MTVIRSSFNGLSVTDTPNQGSNQIVNVNTNTCGCGCDGSSSGSGTNIGIGVGVNNGTNINNPGNGNTGIFIDPTDPSGGKSGTLYPPGTDPQSPPYPPPYGSGGSGQINPDGKDQLFNFDCSKTSVFELPYGSDGVTFDATSLWSNLLTAMTGNIPNGYTPISAVIYVQAWSQDGLNINIPFTGTSLLPEPDPLFIHDTYNETHYVPKTKKTVFGFGYGIAVNGTFYDGPITLKMDGPNDVTLNGQLKGVYGVMKSNPPTRKDAAWCKICLSSVVARGPLDVADYSHSYIFDQHHQFDAPYYPVGNGYRTDDKGESNSIIDYSYHLAWAQNTNDQRGLYISDNNSNGQLHVDLKGLAHKDISGVKDVNRTTRYLCSNNGGTQTITYKVFRNYYIQGQQQPVDEIIVQWDEPYTDTNVTLPLNTFGDGSEHEFKKVGPEIIPPLQDGYQLETLTYRLTSSWSATGSPNYLYLRSQQFEIRPHVG